MALTLSNSKYNRYGIGELLSVDAPMVAMMRDPLQLVAKTKKQGQNDGSSSSSSSSSQRSIFSAYWKTDSKPKKPSLALSASSSSPTLSRLVVVEQGERQQGRRRGQIITAKKTKTKSNTYAYNHDQDPFKYFGIEEEEEYETTATESDDSSVNSYERVLRRNEVEIHTTTTREGGWRSNTCPTSLSACTTFESCSGMVISNRKKTSQSDTFLFAKTSSLKRLSCLRKSRFSFEKDKHFTDNKDGHHHQQHLSNDLPNGNEGKEHHRASSTSSTATATTTTSSVSFESNVEVRLFRPPVEKWAPNGWSSWFGA